jgi:propionyl-CoA carboxylase alpha chain
MFKKVLIANRGEIACRIIRTLHCMGIKTVAVYSEADEGALHVEMADEAYLLGPAPARESYLNVSALLNAAKQSGAEAIHPGYGFLSENPAFAEAVQTQGLIFIGPSPTAIAAMGDKLEAKQFARMAGIPCVPGTDKPIESIEEAEKIASQLDYPLMVKAAAGGGGKGMRIVYGPAQLQDALKGAMHEAHLSFGDERVFLEKYIERPRHIEIQILADTHGNIIHLGERECSLQRRHQKVIEEAPSLSVSSQLRDEMGARAIRLAQAVGYTSAGTVEFMMTPQGDYYFLEMNTRLQVEHPVTECVTGIDLVEEMVRIAAGEPLSKRQSEIKFEGHAIEARIYAEDSARGFLPSIGRLTTYLPSQEKAGELRVDSGVEEGDVITPYYDPLIAKVIVHQPQRSLACDTLLEALNHYYVKGIETNIPFLSTLVHSSFFRDGVFSTATLDKLYEEGFSPCMSENSQIPIGTAGVMYAIRNGLKKAEVTVLIDRKAYPITVSFEGDQFEVLEKEGKTLIIETLWKSGDLLFEGVFNGHGLTLQIQAKGNHDRISWNGYEASTCVVNGRVAELYTSYMPLKQQSQSSRIISAPMPGLIIDLPVCVGETIKSGQPIAIIEAMKMENIIRAKCDGIIDEVYVKKGESVNLDQHLAKIG